jgi:hypothetical protein
VQVNACCNAALLLAHLYNFGAVHCTLVYQLVRRLILSAHASEGEGELELGVLLKLLGVVGTQLRADDPAALVEMIKLHQTNAATSVRVRCVFCVKNFLSMCAAEPGRRVRTPDEECVWASNLTSIGPLMHNSNCRLPRHLLHISTRLRPPFPRPTPAGCPVWPFLGPRIDRRLKPSHPRPPSVVHDGACRSQTPKLTPPHVIVGLSPQDQRQLLSSPPAAGESTSSRKRVFTQMLTELKNNKLKAVGVDTGAQTRLLKTVRKLAADSNAPALKVCTMPPGARHTCLLPLRDSSLPRAALK